MENPKITAITTHNDKEIKGFFGDYRWLSNFEICDVLFEGELYSSSENAYQAAKTLDLIKRKEFLTIKPNESKKLGRKLVIREDWEQVKTQVMEAILMSKFTLNKELRNKLIETNPKYLEETNYWKDTFWGVCDGKGQNNLGMLLMIIRDKIFIY